MDCRKRNARPGEQIMAPLPAARVAPFNPPFTHVGVDYFGPLFVKQGRSEVKRYGCLFTCLTMRAVHIEVAHTLEADSFICAYQRFVSRRGRPRAIYSDNGTNFTGAERELREAFERLDQQYVCNRLRKDDVQWFFNPPEASHQGGIWERMIRSVRKILAALLKEQRINDETLSTLLCEVEKILNDRPLTLLSEHPDDPEPLTPNKLLLLKSNSCLPLDVFKDQDRYSKRWRQAQCLANAFWKRWMKDYLPGLQRTPGSCERSVSTLERFTCLKMRLKLRRSTMNFSRLPHIRTSISPYPRLVYIPLNISICMRTFQDACRSCERSVSTPERFTCLKMRLKQRRSTMNFSQLPHMRTSISPDPRLVFIPLNISISMRTFQEASRSCEKSVSTPGRFTCLKMRLKARRSTMNFSQLPHMRTSISPDPRLVYIPLNISICMRTFQDVCRSCESSVSTPERFTCLKMRLKLRISTMNFSPLPYMRTSISPDPRLVYIQLNISICMRTFQDACRSCERSVSTPERFTCLKLRLKLRRSTMNFSQLPHMRT